MAGPLSHIRVLDLSRVLAAPWLADQVLTLVAGAPLPAGTFIAFIAGLVAAIAQMVARTVGLAMGNAIVIVSVPQSMPSA